MNMIEVELKDSEKSKVKVVYRMYKRGKWLHSDLPITGYKKYYYATKVRLTMYYDTYEKAEAEAERYNEKLKAYKKGRAGKMPEVIKWDMFKNTELQNDAVWWHDSGSWLYSHGYDDWPTVDLLRDDMTFTYDDFDHTTYDFFEVFFKISSFSKFELKKDAFGDWKIFVKND